jgi:hypothetical protein
MRLIRIAIAAEQRAAAVAFSVRLFYWVVENHPDRILELLD